MEQFLYTVRPARIEMLTGGPTPEERRLTGEHFAYLERLTAQGVVFLAGRTQTADPTGLGLVIFRAESPAHAREIVDADPAVRGGVFVAALFPYRVALLARPELQGPWTPGA